MRVAVTGSTGFIGGHLALRLEADGHRVLALGRRPSAPAGLVASDYVSWDLGRGGPAPGAIADCEAVVHVAAHVADWGSRATFQAVTVEGTGRLLDGVAPGARVMVIGSASVYDPRRPHACASEAEAPVERYMNEYGWAKAAQERLIARRRPDALIFRPHAVYGPGDRTLLPRLVDARRHGRLLLPAGGRHVMSVTHVDSLADAVLAGLRRPAVRGPMNVADATPVAPADMLLAVFDALGLRTRIWSIPVPIGWLIAGAAEGAWRVTRRPDAPPLTRYAVSHLAGPFVLDLTRLHAELGIRPDRPHREMLPEVVARFAGRTVAQPSG